jgi:formiminotetrahydrofolate cyclodeaminase
MLFWYVRYTNCGVEIANSDMKLIEQSVAKYSELLASDNPTPGGGTSASLSALLGVSFIIMISRISAKKITGGGEALKEIECRAEELRLLFLRLMDDDTDAYNKIVAVRRRIMQCGAQGGAHSADELQNAYRDALSPPLCLLKNSFAALQLAESLSQSYYTGTASDMGIAANCLAAASRGAYLTILINLPAIKDRDFAEHTKNESHTIVTNAERIAETIYRSAESLLTLKVHVKGAT